MLFSAPSRKFAPVLPYVARKTAWEERQTGAGEASAIASEKRRGLERRLILRWSRDTYCTGSSKKKLAKFSDP